VEVAKTAGMIFRLELLWGMTKGIGDFASVMSSLRSLFLLLASLAGLVHPAFALNRYVATTGTAAGNGESLQQPWSLAKACTSALAGDVVLVQPGVYLGKYEILVSGSEGKPITFRADGPEGAVVIDGTGQAGANDGLIFIRASNSKPLAQDLIVEGFTLRNFLNVNDASGIRMVCRGIGVMRRILIDRCSVQDIRGTNAMGITVYGASTLNAIAGVTLRGCKVSLCEPSPSEAVVFNGNIDGFTVENCLIKDCNNIGLDMIGGEPGLPPAPAAGLVARNGLVKRCRVQNIVNAVGIAAAGIYVDGGRQITIEHCLVEGSDFGIEIGSENTGIITDGVVVRNNLLQNNRQNGLVVGGAEPDNGRVNNCHFYHNLLYANGTDEEFSTELFIQYGSGNVFENNIFHARSDALPSFLYVIGGNTGQLFRNNLWYNPGGNSTLSSDFGWVPEETDAMNPCCSSYQEFRNVTGQDVGGVFADPGFLNAAAGDYHLSPASPARNAGVILAGVDALSLTDLDGLPRLQGTAPDIGLDEVWPVDAWWRVHFPAVPLSAAGLSADHDGDGASNLLEYAGGTQPNASLSSPFFGPVSGAKQGFFFEKAVGASDVEVQLLSSTSLAVWTLSPLLPTISPANGGRQRLEWITSPVSAGVLRGGVRLKP